MPLLAYDFQIMIDSGGNICHFDFDRAFVSGVRKTSDEWLNLFVER